MDYKIKKLGNPRARHITCGIEIMDQGTADLAMRMRGAKVILPEETEFIGDTENGTAYIKPCGISAFRICSKEGGIAERFIQIALSPAKNCDLEPQIALKISGRQLAQLKNCIAKLV